MSRLQIALLFTLATTLFASVSSAHDFGPNLSSGEVRTAGLRPVRPAERVGVVFVVNNYKAQPIRHSRAALQHALATLPASDAVGIVTNDRDPHAICGAPRNTARELVARLPDSEHTSLSLPRTLRVAFACAEALDVDVRFVVIIGDGFAGFHTDLDRYDRFAQWIARRAARSSTHLLTISHAPLLGRDETCLAFFDALQTAAPDTLHIDAADQDTPDAAMGHALSQLRRLYRR